MICQAAGIYQVDAESGFYSLYPALGMTDFTAIGKTFGQCFAADFDGVGIFNFIVVLFSFLFVDIFDTIGTLIGVSSKAGMLDEKEKLPRIKPALLADAIATTAGAVFGTSTTTTFVESSAGVGAGARTGLSSVVTGFLFLLANLLRTDFYSDPGIRNSTGSDLCRIFDDLRDPADRFFRSDRSGTGLSVSACDAYGIQHF